MVLAVNLETEKFKLAAKVEGGDSKYSDEGLGKRVSRLAGLSDPWPGWLINPLLPHLRWQYQSGGYQFPQNLSKCLQLVSVNPVPGARYRLDLCLGEQGEYLG